MADNYRNFLFHAQFKGEKEIKQNKRFYRWTGRYVLPQRPLVAS